MRRLLFMLMACCSNASGQAFSARAGATLVDLRPAGHFAVQAADLVLLGPLGVGVSAGVTLSSGERRADVTPVVSWPVGLRTFYVGGGLSFSDREAPSALLLVGTEIPAFGRWSVYAEVARRWSALDPWSARAGFSFAF